MRILDGVGKSSSITPGEFKDHVYDRDKGAATHTYRPRVIDEIKN